MRLLKSEKAIAKVFNICLLPMTIRLLLKEVYSESSSSFQFLNAVLTDRKTDTIKSRLKEEAVGGHSFFYRQTIFT